jgi:predicted DsbA family dithiol-disulfide isomerase
MAAGNKLSINGTPTFYLDGKQVQVGQSVQAFEQIINAEIAKKAPQASTSSTSTSAAPASTQPAQ